MNLEVQGIYMILNITNKKCYVGSSKNCKARKYRHFSELRNNRHSNSYLQASYNKYGENNFIFIILEEVENIEDLYTKECKWITTNNSLNKEYGYNLGVPERNNGLNIAESTKIKNLTAKYNQWYKDRSDISLEEFLDGRRSHNLILDLGVGGKKVFGFNKTTGEKVCEFNSVGQTVRELNIAHSAVRIALNNLNRSCKGLVLVKEEDYNPDIVYIQKKTPFNYGIRPKKDLTAKSKQVYVPKGRFKGKPVETFNLETRETIEQFNNKHELAEKYNTSVKYVNKIFEGSKKSFRGMGLRYTTN